MRARPLLVAALLFVPLAHASGEQVAGGLVFSDVATLTGAVRIESDHGMVQVHPASLGDAAFMIGWTRATGHYVDVERYSSPLTGGVILQPAERHSLAFTAGSAQTFACGAACKVALMAEPAEVGMVGLEGHASGALAAGSEPVSAGLPGGFLFELAAPTVAATTYSSSSTGLQLADGYPIVSGTVLLLLYDVVVAIEDAQGDHEVRTGEVARNEVPLTQTGRKVDRVAVLWLEDAHVRASPGTASTFHASDARLHLDGVLGGSPEGELTWGDERHDVASRTLEIEGRLVIDASFVRQGVTPLQQQDHLHADVGGEAERVHIAGNAVAPPPGPPVAAIVTGAAIGGLALIPGIRRLFIAAFFSRIGRSRVLDQEARHDLHQALLERPGMNEAQLQRRVGLARGVLRHHLAKLVEHDMLVYHVVGRSRRYYCAGTLPPEADVARHVALEDATRLKVLAAVVEQGPVTRREIARATGVSTRLVSYHLSKLRQESIVESKRTFPQRYVASRKIKSPASHERVAERA